MSLLNPSSVERDNQNALRKYPFADTASCGNGSAVIPPGAVIDAQLYIPGRTPGRVWLSRIDTDGRLHFSDADGEFAVTVAAAQAETAVPVTYTGTGGPLPGGVVVFGKATDVEALLGAGGQTFDAPMTELAPAALAFLGLPGVTGFLLDDGSVVSGNVRFKGANGCRVAAWTDDGGVGHLRISAMGAEASSDPVTGFITAIRAESDNATFVVGASDLSKQVVEILGTGAAFVQAATTAEGETAFEFAGQDDTCAQVRKARGTLPSASGTIPPDCPNNACSTPLDANTITLKAGNETVGTITKTRGAEYGTAPLPDAALIPEGKRFAGYFEAVTEEGVTRHFLRYRADGSGVGRFLADGDLTLAALFLPGSSSVLVTFDGYGTLHLAAPDVPMVYSNPIRITGTERPIPVISETQEATITTGGADALAELVLHPPTPAGEVRIGIRGLNKAYTT